MKKGFVIASFEEANLKNILRIDENAIFFNKETDASAEIKRFISDINFSINSGALPGCQPEDFNTNFIPWMARLGDDNVIRLSRYGKSYMVRKLIDEPAVEISTTTLAHEFSCLLKELLGDDKMQHIVFENRRRNNNTCATHDYCDANIVMSEAFARIYGRCCQPLSDADMAVFSTAWDEAKHSNFFTNY